MLHAVMLSCLLDAASQEPPPQVRIVERPPAVHGKPLYGGNRAPLQPDPLVKLPLGAVRARGWLAHQLRAMAAGMHGHLPEISPWCRPEGNAWLDAQGGGERGWEELPYWLKGAVSLAHLTGDEALLAETGRWIEGILASQRADGWFGPESNLRSNDLWPNMIALWALRSHHEATGDPRVPAFMARYFRWQAAQPPESLLPGSWQKWRGGDNLHEIHWLYNLTGEKWLLDLARTIHERTADWVAGFPTWHGVNICQGFREPAQWYQQSGDPAHLLATAVRYREVMDLYGQVPGGMFGADENCRPGYADPRQAAEACSMVELMLSHEILLGITGIAIWADRCEEIAFNSLPAAYTADLRALHYLTAPNVVQLDHEDHSPGVQNGGCMLAYSAGERYRCCQHNVAHGWPYFTEHLWMATRDGGLAAALYAPSAVTASVARGATVRIEEETGYPFRQTVTLTVAAERPTRFPLYLRIPGWCDDAWISVGGEPAEPVRGKAGSWIVIERTWGGPEDVNLGFDMPVRVHRWDAHGGAASVRRGPLWYSLRVGERWAPNGGSDEWPEWDVLPAGSWNYALELPAGETEQALRLYWRDGDLPEQPFAVDAAPLLLAARARRVPEWGLQWGLPAPLQRSPVRTDEPAEDVLLVPMGCARLRITVFPLAGGPDAARWTPPPQPPLASHVHDDPFALCDGIEPRSSADHDVPRFTWWDHRGTTEWVAYRFPQPRALARAEVYWFDDTGIGLCRVPASWRLLAKAGGEWREVSGASGYGVQKDRFNAVEFDAVTTDEIRLEVQLQDGFSGGILEWRVAGPGD